MDALLLARLQFAATTVYHFFFVPLTLGLSIITAILETLYVRSGNETYKQMTKFWGKLFLINFAMGVVTGIVQEFQFGMNWSEYSRFVGDIFGAPLAIEALLAFFLESTFLGLWVFGWDKMSKRTHAITIWLVAIGANISALWILIANSFMQQPVGYVLRNGRAEMSDFSALLTNPNVWVMFPHTVAAGLTTAAFFMMGISVYHLLRKNQVDLFKRSFRIAAIVGVIATILVAANGHTQTQHMVAVQPMKMAAAEALWRTENPASFSLFTISDQSQQRDLVSIRIPAVLSLLAYNRLDGEVKGILDLQSEYEAKYGPGDYIPPVTLSYWTFRIMVGLGFLMILMSLAAVYFSNKDRLDASNKVLKFYVWALFFPYLANTAGWLLTEMGRAPWIVFGLMKIEKGISTAVPAGQVLLTLVGFTLIYAALMWADVYLLVKFARAGAPTGKDAGGTEDGLPVLVPARKTP